MIYTRFKAYKDILDALVHHKKKVAGRRVGATTGEELALPTLLWSMLYANDARVVSHSLEQVRKMMGVIVVMYQNSIETF